MAEASAAPLNDGDPRSLGVYTLLGRLGHGGMGTVFLGQAPDQRLVAVKVIRGELADEPEFRARFLREVQAARRVARFCTAEVLDVDTDGPRPYLVTEYIEGPTLSAVVAERGRLPIAELERLAVAVAAALNAIHAAGLVHRDLKPNNIILSSSGARVIDFGIARATDATSSLTRTGASIGSPAFMAPEQVVGQQVTGAADIYAWGGVVLYAGTGRMPYGEGSTPAILYRVINNEPDFTGLDESLRPLVERAMAKDPAQRPSAQELFQHLVGSNPGAAPQASPAFAAPGVTPGAAGVTPGTPGVPPWAPQHPDRAASSTPPHSQPVTSQYAPPHTPPPNASGPGGQPSWPAAQHTAETAFAPGQATPPPGPYGSPPGQATPPPGPYGSPDPYNTPYQPDQQYQYPPNQPYQQYPPNQPNQQYQQYQPYQQYPPNQPYQQYPASQPYPPGGGKPSPPRRPTGFRRPQVFIPVVLLAVAVVAAVSVLLVTQTGSDDQATTSSGSPAPTRTPTNITASEIRPVQVGQLAEHSDWVRSVAFSPDGTALASSSDDMTVHLWDVTNPSSAFSTSGPLTGATDWVRSVAFSPDGTLLASGGDDRTIRLWNVADPNSAFLLAELPVVHTDWIRSVAFSPDGSVLAAGSDDTTISLWDVTNPASAAQIGTLTGHSTYVRSVAFSPDGSTLASASEDGTVRLWDVTNPASAHEISALNANSALYAVAYSPDSHTVASGGDDGTVRLWDVTNPASATQIGNDLTRHNDYVNALAFSPDGSTLASGSDDASVVLWDVTDPATAHTIGGPLHHQGGVLSVAFSPDGTILATGATDYSVGLWDLNG